MKATEAYEKALPEARKREDAAAYAKRAAEVERKERAAKRVTELFDFCTRAIERAVSIGDFSAFVVFEDDASERRAWQEVQTMLRDNGYKVSFEYVKPEPGLASTPPPPGEVHATISWKHASPQRADTAEAKYGSATAEPQ